MINRRKTNRRVSDPDRIVHPVRVRAVRAAFIETPGMMHRVELQFEDAKGDITQFDLEVKDAVQLIEDMTAAYQAIVPPLRTSRVGWGS